MSLREVAGGSDGDLVVAGGNSHGGAEVAQLVVHLDVLLQVGLLRLMSLHSHLRRRQYP